MRGLTKAHGSVRAEIEEGDVGVGGNDDSLCIVMTS